MSALPPEAAAPDDTLLKHARNSGDPWVPQNDYFRHAESFMEQSWAKVIWPTISQCNFEHVIDLAAGHGRNSVKLSQHAQRLLVLDIQEGNVAACRSRFEGDARFSFAVNNGYDLQPAGDADFTLVYCFDAMVHFHREVVASYLRDTHRVLRAGGHGFFHHSNYTGGDDWRTGPASRAFMSRELFAQLAAEAGLTVLTQRVMDWNRHSQLDCVSLLHKST